MVFPTRFLLKRLAGGVTCVALLVVLVACGGNKGAAGGNAGNGTAANATRQMAPTMTATTVAIQATMGLATTTPAATNATPVALKKTYKGTGFTISYPAAWKATPSGAEVALTDPTGAYNLTIGSTSNPEGVKTSVQLVDGGIAGAKTSLKNVQAVEVAPTVKVGGQSWNQQAIAGTSTLNGQSAEVEAVVLADNHPTHNARTKGYVIVYVAGKTQFDQAQLKYFQPMLQSFRYTA